MAVRKKYELTDETIEVCRQTLYRIKALRSFGDVKIGEIGGYIEKEANLSHEGNCWVADEACVFDDAKVYENARVYSNAWVLGRAKAYGNAKVYGNARISGYAKIFGNAKVGGYSKVSGYEDVSDNEAAYMRKHVSHSTNEAHKNDNGKARLE
ncbi:hypothetical protein NPX99_08635, partial [Bartonella sp. 220]|nr:hypothetical protein [Bartonella sp. 220B]